MRHWEDGSRAERQGLILIISLEAICRDASVSKQEASYVYEKRQKRFQRQRIKYTSADILSTISSETLVWNFSQSHQCLLYAQRNSDSLLYKKVEIKSHVESRQLQWSLTVVICYSTDFLLLILQGENHSLYIPFCFSDKERKARLRVEVSPGRFIDALSSQQKHNVSLRVPSISLQFFRRRSTFFPRPRSCTRPLALARWRYFYMRERGLRRYDKTRLW